MTQASALYRRYRPDTFADVIGQEHVTVPLMTALKKNRVNHAYLFSGPRGCGKTTSARILARCLNCEQGPTDTPCGVCPSCVELARGGAGSLDVIEIDAASHGGVDDARDLRERATFAPARDRYKIFIIDEAHMVTSAGFNALLKIVEEPPEHIKFIFATTEPDKVIGTIRSRTHHYPFRLVPPEPLLAYLEQLCEQENVPVAPGVLSLVIRAGGGSVRDSLSVLDQLMAGAGPQGLDYELAVSLLGYTHASLLDDVVDAVAAHDSATVFRAVDRVLQTGHDPRRFVEDLLERFRDLIIVQAMPDSAATILRGMPQDQIARMRQQAVTLGPAELSRSADVTNAALSEMTGATSPRLHLELLCARLMLPASDSTERGAAARLDALERRLALGGAPAQTQTPAPAPAQVSAPAPTPASAPAVPRNDDAAPASQRPAAAPAAAPVVEPASAAETTNAPDLPVQQASTPPARERPADAAPAPTPAAAPPAEPVSRAREAAPSSVAAAQSTAAPSAPAQTPPPAPQQQAAPAPQGGGDVEALRRAWPQILDRLGKIKRSTWALVAPNATVARLDGDAVILSFSTPGLAGAFGRGDHKTHLQTAVKEVLGLDCRVEAVAGDAAAPPPSFQTSRPSAPEEPSMPSPAAGPATAEEPPGWGDSPKAPASQENIPPASGSGRTAPQRTVPSGDFHPLDQPRDEDEPPLDDEPPYDDGPSDWGRPSAPATPATPAARQAARPATAAATAAAAPTAEPAASGGPSAVLQDDPWSRAREVSPGRWTVGTESNVSTGNGGSAASTAIPGQGFQEPEFEDEDLADEDLSGSGPAPAAAEAPAGDPWGLPAEPVTTPERMDAAGPATAASAPAVAPASRPTEASAPGEPGAGNDSRDGSQSLYQRLSNSPQAQRAREEARRAAPPQELNPDGSVAGYAVDEISADDETIEESSTFGRAAVERLLDGTLIEETTLDGTPIIRR
ncbi:DNA polymerase-3 subunit gamma/tau [Arthrobacter woluwensis]|uniref:DNA polymerase III subunit gamma and tau n=1 Tax=Arthrobacter woluwensis TaxID=156980 RepID=UPI0027818C06|nr:DNA polymerase III subunit gamma and tau [Arthrobacter woluwensis]MDQ0707587.1 DNA polymerase-3 subunit gamma/tau [Arthrobacter woluwensis]